MARFIVKSSNHYTGREYENDFETVREALDFADNEASEGIYASVYNQAGELVESFQPDNEGFYGPEDYCGYDVDAAGNCYSDADPGL